MAEGQGQKDSLRWQFIWLNPKAVGLFTVILEPVIQFPIYFYFSGIIHFTVLPCVSFSPYFLYTVLMGVIHLTILIRDLIAFKGNVTLLLILKQFVTFSLTVHIINILSTINFLTLLFIVTPPPSINKFNP